MPLGKSNQLPKDKSPDDFFGELRRKREAEGDNEEPYIAAKFSPSELPTTFNVGDESFKNLYGYYNKKLTKGSYYTMFTRAYVKSDKGVRLCDITVHRWGRGGREGKKKRYNWKEKWEERKDWGEGLVVILMIHNLIGSISVSGQLPTYPSPNTTLTLTCYQ